MNRYEDKDKDNDDNIHPNDLEDGSAQHHVSKRPGRVNQEENGSVHGKSSCEEQ